MCHNIAPAGQETVTGAMGYHMINGQSILRCPPRLRYPRPPSAPRLPEPETSMMRTLRLTLAAHALASLAMAREITPPEKF